MITSGKKFMPFLKNNRKNVIPHDIQGEGTSRRKTGQVESETWNLFRNRIDHEILKQVQDDVVFTFFVFALVMQGLNSVYAKELPKVRGMNIEPVSIKDYPDVIDNYIKNNQNNLVKNDATNTGEVISGIVGKSKFIRFDSPVKRISIANPDLADLVLISPKEMIINGKQAGTTSLIIWGDSQDPIFLDLQVQSDTQAFLKELKTVAPNEKINISFKESNAILSGNVSSTILKDKIKTLAKAYGFETTDLADSPSSQVLLEVKIIEASKAFTKIMASTFQKGSWGSIPKTIPGVPTDQGTINSLIQTGLDNASFDGTVNGFQLFRNLPGMNLGYYFKAAEQKGIAKVLAEPKIITLNDQEASFNAGQQVPVPSGMSQTGQVTFTYKDIGVSVKFKPTILQNLKRIKMTVNPEVSEIDSTASVQNSDGSISYGFKTRKVSTSVELNDGETFVLAGLYKRTNQDTKTILPLLGDIPFIGSFFRNRNLEKDETELMIFVTPKIIEPTQESNI
ncbi:MAG: pilus assembly protein N-terminal domain-containing protein [Candidatus Gastranaerophilaceae bacterium]|jgi:pilus assembly protein CpaC